MVVLSRIGGRATFRLPVAEISGLLRPRSGLVCVVLAAAVAGAFAVAVARGDVPIALTDVAAALAGSGDEATLFVVWELRLPRALVGLGVGAAFGMSGAVFQTLTRNPLASPDMLGINAGAATAVVAGIVLGFGAGIGAQALGLAGGLASAVAIYLLAWRRGTTGYRIVLVGIGVSWLCTAITSHLLVKAEIWQAQDAMQWLLGSLNARDWVHVYPLELALAVLVPAALAAGRWLRLLALGDETAGGLGVPVQTARLLLMLVGVGFATFATAAAGPIVFVALLAPQIAKRLAGLTTPPLVASALSGSLIVLIGDLLARQALPVELPIGVVTGAVGGPVLLLLLARANRAGTGG